MEKLLEKIKEKKLLFSVTTGRSGTNYLSLLLGLLKDFRSEHEAIPGFHEYYRDILNGKYTFRDFWLFKKLPYIAYDVKEQFYADISHVACKGFFESLLEMGVRPSFVMIKRDNREVAKSLLQLNTIPVRTVLGQTFLNSPDDPDVLKIHCDFNALSDYQLCYWYTMEIDRRIEQYKKYFNDRDCRYVYLTFEELVNGDGFNKLVKELNLPSMSLLNRLKYIKRKRVSLNQKTRSKRELISLDFDREEMMLKQFVQ